MSWKDKLLGLLPHAKASEPAIGRGSARTQLPVANELGEGEFDAGAALAKQSEQAAKVYRRLLAKRLASESARIAAEHGRYNARLREVNYQRRMQGLRPIRWGALTELPTPPPMPGVLTDVKQRD